MKTTNENNSKDNKTNNSSSEIKDDDININAPIKSDLNNKLTNTEQLNNGNLNIKQNIKHIPERLNNNNIEYEKGLIKNNIQKANISNNNSQNLNANNPIIYNMRSVNISSQFHNELKANNSLNNNCNSSTNNNQQVANIKVNNNNSINKNKEQNNKFHPKNTNSKTFSNNEQEIDSYIENIILQNQYIDNNNLIERLNNHRNMSMKKLKGDSTPKGYESDKNQNNKGNDF